MEPWTRADQPDAVVHVDMSARKEIGPGQHGNQEIRLARAEALSRARSRQIDGRKNGQDGNAAGVGPETQLGAELDITQARLGALGLRRRCKTVRPESNLQPIRQSD